MSIISMSPHHRTLQKISGPAGSNEGGWFQDTQTDAVYYVKFHKRELNSKLEYFANLIYQKLGVYVPTKSLDTIDGRLAIVSEKVGAGERATKEEQKDHPDLVAGFVADAYLNNWDVVGDVFDNIVKDERGHLYRVDNGGIGPVRASEGRKNFRADTIPELDDMRDPKFHAGYVFQNVTEHDIRENAIRLVECISEDFLTESLTALRLEDNDMEEILAGFLSRRNYLHKRYARIST